MAWLLSLRAKRRQLKCINIEEYYITGQRHKIVFTFKEGRTFFGVKLDWQIGILAGKVSTVPTESIQQSSDRMT